MKTDLSPSLESSYLKRTSWGAIFAGGTIAIIIQLLLTLLGIGIGAASINPLQEQTPGEGLAVGSLIWFVASSLIAMYVGGRVAGGYSNCPSKKDRMHHGIFAWAATTILSAVFLASAMTSLLGSATGSAVATRGGNQPSSAPFSMPGTSRVSEPEARQAGDVAAKRIAQSALGTFALLLLSGVAAALGGRNSAPTRHDEQVDPTTTTQVTPAFAK